MSDYDGKAWEEKVKTWLRIRYPRGEFVEVPDQHGGDFGIEGYSRDGIVYQCYAPRESLKAADLYENQKIKITKDIHKFISNKDDLSKLFGNIVIEKYWLVTPEHKSARLVQLATEKASEVIAANLPYVASNFHIDIVTHAQFKIEREQALRRGLEKISIEYDEPDSAIIQQYQLDNEVVVQRLDGKVGRLVASKTDQGNISLYRDEFLKWYLRGNNQKERLRHASPALYEDVDQCRKRKEKRLCMLNIESPAPPRQHLREQREQLTRELQEAVPGLHPETIQDLAFGIASGWMVQCNLDFIPDNDDAGKSS
jgi:hypothetical protein